MTAFFIFYAKVIVCSALFAGCYWFVLRNTQIFQWNRFYILTSVALSVIIPLLNINISATNVALPAIPALTRYFVIASDDMAVSSVVQPDASPVSWTWLFFAAYLSIVLFLMAREVVSLVHILRIKRRSERIQTSETVIYCTNDASAPFTFFRDIFWKKDIPVDSNEGLGILRHELAHVRLCHGLDKALMQLVCCLFWMNPFFLLLRRELELVHEFEADSESAEDFSSLILSTLYPKHYHDLLSRFFQSPINRRIFMFTKKKKSTMNMLRRLSIVPVALVAIYLFACNNTGKNVKEAADADELSTLSESKTMYEISDTLILFATVDVKPLFDGQKADSTFRVFVYKNIVYPPTAIENGISGRVFTEFTIDTDGSLIDIRMLRSADPLLTEEALRVLNISPKWTPGRHQGKLVKVRYQFPFVFHLSE